MEFETLLYEKGHRMATFSLNRPERHSAFDWTMAQAMTEKRELHWAPFAGA